MDKDLLFGYDKTQDNEDRKISYALMSSFVILTIQYLFLIYFNLIGTGVENNIQLISKALVGLVYVYVLPSVLKRNFKMFIITYSIAFFVFLSHYFIFNENKSYIISLIFPYFFMCLPSFLYILSVRNLHIFRKVTLEASYVVFYIGALIGVLVFLGKVSVGTYSMALSYYMLLPTVNFLEKLLERFSLKMFVFSLFSLLIIVSLGSRGALLCGAVFIILKLLRTTSKRPNNRFIKRYFIFCVGVLIIIFAQQLFLSLDIYLQNVGLKSRTLSLFFNSGLHLSGRDRLYKRVFEEIIKKPILGIGLAGDTRIIGSSYVHNFFIEVIGNFGIIFGILISITIIYLIAKLLLTKNLFNYNLIIMWLSLGFVHLMVSSSYLIDIKFWIFLGLMINMMRQREQTDKSISNDVLSEYWSIVKDENETIS